MNTVTKFLFILSIPCFAFSEQLPLILSLHAEVVNIRLYVEPLRCETVSYDTVYVCDWSFKKSDFGKIISEFNKPAISVPSFLQNCCGERRNSYIEVALPYNDQARIYFLSCGFERGYIETNSATFYIDFSDAFVKFIEKEFSENKKAMITKRGVENRRIDEASAREWLTKRVAHLNNFSPKVIDSLELQAKNQTTTVIGTRLQKLISDAKEQALKNGFEILWNRSLQKYELHLDSLQIQKYIIKEED